MKVTVNDDTWDDVVHIQWDYELEQYLLEYANGDQVHIEAYELVEVQL